MNFTAVWKLASAVSLASLLTACGGGGGGEDSTPFQPGQGSITIQATRTTLPNNVYNVSPFLGSPYMSELTVTVKTASGQLVNAADGLAVSVNPVANTGGFSTLDDGITADVNEFLVRLGQGPVDITAGKSTLFLHSFEFTGTTTLTVTATDPGNTAHDDRLSGVHYCLQRQQCACDSPVVANHCTGLLPRLGWQYHRADGNPCQ